MANELDVIVVGAGLSGVGAGVRLLGECPGKTFAILEARDAIGGTWDLFRYPGARSDSDMYTLGYPFHPWKGDSSIASGPAILAYVRDTAEKFGVVPHIRFRHRIVEARWSSADARWTLDVDVGEAETKRREVFRCHFLYICAGYYRYDTAHQAELRGLDQFTGQVVHPQWWPEQLDYTGKRVVVIGSGATAVTIVPAMTDRAAHVTMLQRSPSYIASFPRRDVIANALRKVLPSGFAHRWIRRKNAVLALAFFLFCRWFPRAATRLLHWEARKVLPKGYPIERHLTPSYPPWDQRMCVVPDGDLFHAIAAGKAAIATDTIDTFTPTGIRLASGETLDADIVVTATGLKIQPVGGIRMSVDGRAVELASTLVYKGMMLSGVPNLAWCVGYTNASWTLRADLSSRYVCRLLRYMDRHGHDQALPYADPTKVEERPLLDLSSGYIARAAGELPRQGSRAPWFLRQNYILDALASRFGRLVDPSMRFSHHRDHVGTAVEPGTASRAA